MEHLSQIDLIMPALYYNHIVKTLYYEKEMDLLAMFCSSKQSSDACTFEDVKVLISVFLEINLLANAYKLQNNFLMKSKETSLFNYFIEECKSNKLLGKLITLALTDDEEVNSLIGN